MGKAFKIVPLGHHHDRGAFCCGRDKVNAFIRSRDCLDAHINYKHRVHIIEGDDANRILAFCCLRIVSFGSRKTQPDIELHMIGVATESQRQGIGTALLFDVFDRVSQIANSVGVTHLWLEAENNDAYRLYSDLGFSPVHSGSPRMYIAIATLIDGLNRQARP